MQPLCSYLICATPHSGSTLLCEALKNTGSAGWPEEFFTVVKNTPIQEPLARYPQPGDEPGHWRVLTVADYITRVLEVGTSYNGVFGAAVMWSYFDEFICSLRHSAARREMGVLDLLPTVFPNLHYIWVTRRNKVQQAVAMWNSFQRQVWRQDEPTSPKREAALHFEMIDRLAQQIVADETDWRRYFDTCGIQPFTVVYEDMVGAVELTAQDVLRYLQIPIPAYWSNRMHGPGAFGRRP